MKKKPATILQTKIISLKFTFTPYFPLNVFLAHDLLLSSSFGSECNTRHPESIPSADEIYDLSKDISQCWDSLGLKLGVSSAKLDEIEGNNLQYPNPAQKAYRMLRAWHDKGSASTYGKLADALRKVGKAGLAEELLCGK